MLVPVQIALDYRPAVHSHAGIARAVRQLAIALAERDDIDLHLFAHSVTRASSASRSPARATLHRLPIPGRALPLLSRLGLSAELLAGNPEVFHWTDYVHPPIGKARIVLTVHDLAFIHDESWHGADAKILLARTARAVAAAHTILVPSRATQTDVQKTWPTARTTVIPFGSDHVPTTKGPQPFGGMPYVLCLGTIEPRKNHSALLAAFRQLSTPRPLLVVVGRRGWEDAAIVEQLRAAQQEGGVQWLPQAGDEEVFSLLAHAQLLVYPSLWEGFGFPPLEAMAFGVPVIANDCAPMRELTDGAAVLCDARSPAALSAAIDRLLHDREARLRGSAAGRVRAACFRWRDCAAAHARIYREVLK
ncbi:glycosyl transferase family 1 [Planctomycetota bacterium]|nr:glycosyl transferase family 1 [Planctomycetota bacterium]